MFTTAVRRSFNARHFLIGGEWGGENEPHSHAYRIELALSGRELDRHGYLADIVEIEGILDGVSARYRDRMLNDLPEFADVNPSLERFCRIVADSIAERISAPGVSGITVTLWENEDAWASYRRERSG